MSKIVYLFGAGASANALPIVNQMPKRLGEIISQIENDKLCKNRYSHPNETDKDTIAKFEWLKQGCEKHATVDTFAKKLYLTNKEEYEDLKCILSAYFALEQKIRKPDNRYDAFFASLFGNTISDLPKHVSILSWNYDCQFELAYREYVAKGLNEIWQDLNISTKKEKCQSVKNSFNITKLNGTALMGIEGSNMLDPFGDTNDEIVDTIHNIYFRAGYASNVVKHLSFAWENDHQTNFYKTLDERISDAEVLVVIGYSFPFFNRQVDRHIFKKMNNLSKIYIQSPNADEVEQSMMTVLSNVHLNHPSLKRNIVKLSEVGHFYLPAEL